MTRSWTTILMVVGVLAAAAAPGWAALENYYNYHPGQLSVADDWSFEGQGSFINTIFSYSTVNNRIHIYNKYGGASYVHRLAYTWTAPEGEFITQVNCDWSRYGYLSVWNIAWYASSDSDAAIGDMDVVWTSNASTSSSRIQTFDPELKITKIGLGSLSNASDSSHEVAFNYISITTVPEPATIGLLAFGTLALLRRRK